MALSPREKYDRYTTAHTKVLDAPFAGVPAGARLHISTPRDLEAQIRTIPAGTTIDVATLRAEIAARHDADATCPVTTAMYLRIVIEIALDELARDSDADVAPFWRVVEPDSAIARRVDGASDLIADLRRSEGITSD